VLLAHLVQTSPDLAGATDRLASRSLPAFQERLRGLAAPCPDRLDLDAALDRVGFLIAMSAHEPDANSLYEHLQYRLLEATVWADPRGLGPLLSLLARAAPPAALAAHAHRYRLAGYTEVPGLDACRTELDVLTAYFDHTERLRARGYAPVGAGLSALGYRHLRESLHQALVDWRRRSLVRAALAACRRSPLTVLVLDRLFHLLESHEYTFKLRELAELPWATFELADLTAFVGGGTPLEPAIAAVAAGAGPASSPVFVELTRRLSRGSCRLRFLSRQEMAAWVGSRMGPGARVDNVTAFRRREGEVDELVMLEELADPGTAIHELVHVLQLEREGLEWMATNTVAREMEAFRPTATDGCGRPPSTSARTAGRWGCACSWSSSTSGWRTSRGWRADPAHPAPAGLQSRGGGDPHPRPRRHHRSARRG